MAEAPIWRCAEETLIPGTNKTKKCEYMAKVEEFGPPGDRKCPKCGSEDVFPHRLYKCKRCGKVDTQNFWFPEFPLDEDPLEEGTEAEPCDNCADEFPEGEEPLAELEEIPVELPNV